MPRVIIRIKCGKPLTAGHEFQAWVKSCSRSPAMMMSEIFSSGTKNPKQTIKHERERERERERDTEIFFTDFYYKEMQ